MSAEPLTSQDIGVQALEFLDNLDDGDHYAAIFIVAGLDDNGDIYVQMRTSDSNGLSNIQVLQEAQLLETRNALDDVDAS